MNKARRAQLYQLYDQVDALMIKVQGDLDDKEDATRTPLNWAELKTDVQAARDDAEGIKDDEQEYYDNMPSGLQGGEKGDNAQSVVSELDDADTAFSEADTAIDDEDHEEVISHLETAKEHIDNAKAY